MNELWTKCTFFKTIFCLTLLVSLQVVSHEQMVCAKRFLWVDGFKFLFFALHPLPLSNATEELKGDPGTGASILLAGMNLTRNTSPPPLM